MSGTEFQQNNPDSNCCMRLYESMFPKSRQILSEKPIHWCWDYRQIGSMRRKQIKSWKSLHKWTPAQELAIINYFFVYPCASAQIQETIQAACQTKSASAWKVPAAPPCISPWARLQLPKILPKCAAALGSPFPPEKNNEGRAAALDVQSTDLADLWKGIDWIDDAGVCWSVGILIFHHVHHAMVSSFPATSKSCRKIPCHKWRFFQLGKS